MGERWLSEEVSANPRPVPIELLPPLSPPTPPRSAYPVEVPQQLDLAQDALGVHQVLWVAG
jgi:hypothetical protein